MFQGTTPTLTLTFDEDIDFSDAKSVVVTFATDYHKTITEMSGDELTINKNIISISFTQEESLAFLPGPTLVQVNALYEDGTRIASNIGAIEWVKNLKNEVME